MTRAPHVVLGLPPDPTKAAVKAAYRHLAKRLGNGAAFHELQTARDTLLGRIARPRVLTVAELRQREDEYEAYYTPGPVAEQGLRGMAVRFGLIPDVVVDLGCGAGVFGQRSALVWAHAHRIGVEIREEMAVAARHYEQFVVGDFRSPIDMVADLVVSNPPFSLTALFLERGLQLVRPGGFVLLFVRQSWGYSDADFSLLQHLPPLDEWPIPGRCNLRHGIGRTGRVLSGDNHGHKWLIWRRGLRSPVCSWTTWPVPALPSTFTRWELTPGTEAHVEPLDPAFWPDGARAALPARQVRRA